MRTIRHIDAYSAGITVAAVYAVIFSVIGLIRFITFAFFGSLPTFPIYYSVGVPEAMPVLIALVNYLLGIVFSFAGGFGGGLVIAWLYNRLAPLVGGVRVQID